LKTLENFSIAIGFVIGLKLIHRKRQGNEAQG